MEAYKFIVCEGYTRKLSLKECQQACCGCGANSAHLYYLELLKRLKKSGVENEYMFLPPEGFKATGELNPFEIIKDLYDHLFHDDWERCLSRKQNIADCVYGCNSSIMDRHQPLFHPHQGRGTKHDFLPAFNRMAEKLTKEVETQEFTDFESIIGYLHHIKASHPEDYKNFGKLAIYDTALRLAWHAEKGKESLLPKKVYIHQGAYYGAESLFKLGLLSGLEGRGSISKLDSLESSQFPAPISDMEPHHIENLLCIFHPLFGIWEKMLLP